MGRCSSFLFHDVLNGLPNQEFLIILYVRNFTHVLVKTRKEKTQGTCKEIRSGNKKLLILALTRFLF
mgnify:CR=1 FL=1